MLIVDLDDVIAASPLAAAIRRVAYEYCDGSVAYILEGGYGIEALTRSIGLIAGVHDAAVAAAPAADPAAIPQDARWRLDAIP